MAGDSEEEYLLSLLDGIKFENSLFVKEKEIGKTKGYMREKKHLMEEVLLLLGVMALQAYYLADLK